jgi:hypothetical protein
MREPAQFAPAVAGDAEKSVDCCASCGYFTAMSTSRTTALIAMMMPRPQPEVARAGL